jgi:DNA-binding transcriptional LysR family regulator
VRLEYLHPNQVYDAVENDNADLGLVSYPRASRTLEAILWREEPMALVCSPTHELAGRASAGLEDLQGRRMVAFESGLMIRREIDRELQLRQVEVEVAMEFDNIETIKRAIEIDAGVSLLPEPTIVREVESGTLVKVPLAGGPLLRPIGIIHRRGKHLTGTARRFLELLQARAGGSAGEAGGRVVGIDDVAPLESVAAHVTNGTNGTQGTNGEHAVSNGAAAEKYDDRHARPAKTASRQESLPVEIAS